MMKKTMMILICLLMAGLAQAGTPLKTGEKFKIHLKNGAVLKGVVLAQSDSTFSMQSTISKTILEFPKSDIGFVETIKIPKSGSLGLGFGIEYGVIGGNFEKNLGNQLALSAGFGTTVISGMAYNVGLKWYFSDVGSTWRPRIGLYYGTNTFMVEDYDLTDEIYGAYYEQQTFPGISVSFGQVWWLGDSKRHGFSLDVVYVTSSEAGDFIDKVNDQIDVYNMRSRQSAYYYYWEYEKIEDPSGLKISFGYRYSF